MFQEAIAGKAAGLIRHCTIHTEDQHAVAVWQKAAEECVLARIGSLRIVGGLPRHKPPLSSPERLSRLQALLKFWANGCVCAVDEELFADILRRANRPV